MTLDDLRKEPHLSASAINDYRDCSLLYRFGRVDRIPPESVSDALVFGSAIHQTLSSFYREKMKGTILLLRELVAVFETVWQKAVMGREDILFAEGNDSEKLLRDGKELLTAFYDNLPDDSFTTVAVDEPFRFTIPDLPVPVIGAIDLIEEDQSGVLIVSDFKTRAKAYTTEEVEKNFQLTLYQMAVKGNGFNNRSILLRFDALIKTKTPKFEQYWTSRTPADEVRAKRILCEVWKGIENNVFIPHEGIWKCKNCRYKTYCKEWCHEK